MNTNRPYNAIPTVPQTLEFKTRYGTFSFVVSLWADGTVRSQDVLNDAAEQVMQLGRHELDTISRNVDALLRDNDNVRSLDQSWVVEQAPGIDFAALTCKVTIKVALSHGDAAKKDATILAITSAVHAVADNAVRAIADVLSHDSVERANTINQQAAKRACPICRQFHGDLSDVDAATDLLLQYADQLRDEPPIHLPTTDQNGLDDRYTRITGRPNQIIRGDKPYRADLGDTGFGRFGM